MKRGRVADPHIGNTPVSCRRDSRGDFVTMADAIEEMQEKSAQPMQDIGGLNGASRLPLKT